MKTKRHISEQLCIRSKRNLRIVTLNVHFFSLQLIEFAQLEENEWDDPYINCLIMWDYYYSWWIFIFSLSERVSCSNFRFLSKKNEKLFNKNISKRDDSWTFSSERMSLITQWMSLVTWKWFFSRNFRRRTNEVKLLFWRLFFQIKRKPYILNDYPADYGLWLRRIPMRLLRLMMR